MGSTASGGAAEAKKTLRAPVINTGEHPLQIHDGRVLNSALASFYACRVARTIRATR